MIGDYNHYMVVARVKYLSETHFSELAAIHVRVAIPCYFREPMTINEQFILHGRTDMDKQEHGACLCADRALS